MRNRDAVAVEKAQRALLAAIRAQQHAAHIFSLAREAKRRAEAAWVDALERSK